MRSLAVALALALAAPAAAEGGADQRELRLWTLEWRVPDETVILGETEAIEVELRAFEHDGTPIDEIQPVFDVSTGALSAPRRVAPGVFRARFTPPEERYPHLAVLGARIDRPGEVLLGFAAIPLWGKGKLLVRTDPRAVVELAIGDRKFGPKRADDQGRAYVDILAPPGPERAVARSVDEAGNRTEKVVGLGVPPFNRLALFPLQDVLVADGTGDLEIIVYAVDKKGQPLFEAPLEVTAAPAGDTPAPVPLAAGVYRARYRPESTGEEEAKITVRLARERRSKTTLTIPFIPGAPERVELSASPAALRGDEDAVVEVTARFFDQAGNPVTTRATSLSVDAGRIESIEEIGEGVARAKWRVTHPRRDAPPTFIAADRTGRELGRVSLEVTAGPPARLELKPIPPLVGDGTGVGEVVAAVVDVAGNPVPGREVELRTDIGELVGRETDADGRARARLVAPIADRELRGLITAASGSLTTTQPVRVLARDAARLSVGVGLRGDWAYADFVAGGPELDFRLRAPFLFESAQLHLSLASLFATPVDDDGVTRAHAATPLSLGLSSRQDFSRDLALYAGGGLGLVMSDSERLTKPISERRVVAAPYGYLGIDGEYALGKGALGVGVRLGAAFNVGVSPVVVPLGTGLRVYYRVDL